MADICGQCNESFKDEGKYLEHVCATTGVAPTDPANLGEDFPAISEAALERGNARKDLEAEGKTPEEAISETRDLGKVAK